MWRLSPISRENPFIEIPIMGPINMAAWAAGWGKIPYLARRMKGLLRRLGIPKKN
jgi:hypothetical protein